MKFADMHCDTIYELYHAKEKISLKENRLHIDLRRLQEAGYLLQNFAVFVDLETTGTPCEEALGMIGLFQKEMKSNENIISQVFSFDDIQRNRAAGRISGVLTIEEGAVLEGDAENLKRFYELGVRMMNLTWNFPNEIGFPNLVTGEKGLPAFEKRNERGLTPFGFDVITQMEELGMIIDVSHLSDGGFWDVCNHTKSPFVASHSNAAALCNVSRNLTDDMIRAIAHRGGIIGLNFCEDFLKPGQGGDASSMADYMAAQLRHLKTVGGIQVCALGSDFDGIPQNRDIQTASHMPLFAQKLEEAGFSVGEIEQICWGNLFAFYRENL